MFNTGRIEDLERENAKLEARIRSLEGVMGARWVDFMKTHECEVKAPTMTVYGPIDYLSPPGFRFRPEHKEVPIESVVRMIAAEVGLEIKLEPSKSPEVKVTKAAVAKKTKKPRK